MSATATVFSVLFATRPHTIRSSMSESPLCSMRAHPCRAVLAKPSTRHLATIRSAFMRKDRIIGMTSRTDRMASEAYLTCRNKAAPERRLWQMEHKPRELRVALTRSMRNCVPAANDGSLVGIWVAPASGSKTKNRHHLLTQSETPLLTQSETPRSPRQLVCAIRTGRSRRECRWISRTNCGGCSAT
jgi:hypothetical protein